MAAVMSLPSDSDFTANNTLLMRSCVQTILHSVDVVRQ